MLLTAVSIIAIGDGRLDCFGGLLDNAGRSPGGLTHALGEWDIVLIILGLCLIVKGVVLVLAVLLDEGG